MLYVNKVQVGAVGVAAECVGAAAVALTALANDNLVHDFVDWDEARDFVATPRGTDCIGNLSAAPRAGTWLRFRMAGLNIVGEKHTFVPMDQTAVAVGSTNFIHEPFATDRLDAGTHFRAAYLAVNGARLTNLGVNLDGDLTLVGGESMLPKIGFGFAVLTQFLAGGQVDDLKASGGYVGQPLQRMVKIGWGWAKDLVGKTGRTVAEDALVAVVSARHDVLDPFVTSLDVSGHIGDSLAEDAHEDKPELLLELSGRYLPVLIERTQSDLKITAEERAELGAMKTDTVPEKQEMFTLWREFSFASAVADAARRGVRYAGMGDDHRKWLQDNHRVPNGAHVHILTPAAFDDTVEDMRLT